MHVSRMCLRQLALDRIWWLVSPQNRLKSTDDMAPLAERLAGARRVAAAEPRIDVTDIERHLKTQATIHTLTRLTQRFPHIRFVWLMGADNLLQFPRWHRWQAIADTMPIAVYPRPGTSTKARRAPALGYFKDRVLDPADGPALADMAPPIITVLTGTEHPASATEIRSRTNKP